MSEDSSLATPLSELDPADRALLELRFRRSLDDDELATLLGIERREVERRYAGVLDHLAGPDADAGARRRIEDELERELGSAPRDGESGPAFRLRQSSAGRERDTGNGRHDETQPRGRLVRLGGTEGRGGLRERMGPRGRGAEGGRGRARSRPRAGTILLGLLALAVIAAGAVALLRGSGDGSPGSGGSAAPSGTAGSQPSRPSAPRGGRGGVASATESRADSPPTRLRAVSPSFPDAAGTARLVGSGRERRLALTFENLIAPKGDYVLWLYNSDRDAASFARFAVRAERLTVLLPPDAARFRSLDLSDEPDDGDPGHDGVSVLRGPRPIDRPQQ